MTDVRMDGALKSVKKKPAVLVLCGSFSPITLVHLRVLERAKEELERFHSFDVIGGFLSPVSDCYVKSSLIAAHHRLQMCILATESSTWIRADSWESSQSSWTTTIELLKHYKGSFSSNVSIILVVGSDLFATFLNRSLWPAHQLMEIFSNYTVVVVERLGSIDSELVFNQLATEFKEAIENVVLCREYFEWSLSSTAVRLMLKDSFSVKYLLDDSVIRYISENSLYR